MYLHGSGSGEKPPRRYHPSSHHFACKSQRESIVRTFGVNRIVHDFRIRYCEPGAVSAANSEIARTARLVEKGAPSRPVSHSRADLRRLSGTRAETSSLD